MALKSMTGFGEGAAAKSGLSVVVELSSVNRKQLDVNVTLPRNLSALDAQIQQQVRAEFSRGRISGIVRVESRNGTVGTVAVDEQLAAQYAVQLRSTAEKLKLTDDLTASLLASLPGVVSVEQAELDTNLTSEVLEAALTKALRGLARMRSAEGKALEKDLRDRIALLDEQLKQIQKRAPHVVKDYRERLQQRLSQADLGEVLTNDERIIKEVAIFADRCDISEELTRLKSHIAQARKLLRDSEPVGRTLDFLCQELFREINTIGSKANEVEITREVVAFKTELERIREQVQNIE